MTGLFVGNASALQPAVESLGLSETRLERMFESCGLPPAIASRPEGIIPLHAAEHFLDLAHRTAGDNTYCFRSFDKEEARSDGVVANAPLPNAATGLDAVRLFARSLDGIITGSRFYCQLERKHIWVLRTSSATDFSDEWSVLQYSLRAILSGMKRLLGADVSPAILRLPSAYANVTLPEDIRALRIVRKGRSFGLGYPVSDVVLATRTLPTTPADHSLYQRLHRPSENDVAKCLLNFIGNTDGRQLAARAANAFGVSLRTYQRRLEELGTTHADVLGNARISLALERLAAPEVSVTEIAFELGYPFPGHFTRFFRRRMGVSPLEYRRSLLEIT